MRHCDICKYIYTNMTKNNENVIFRYVKFTNPLSFQSRFKKSRSTYRWPVDNPRHQNTTRTISCKAWNSPVKYPSRESKHDIKKSEGYTFNPTLRDNVQAQKHPWGWAVAEPKLISFRKYSAKSNTNIMISFISQLIVCYYHKFHVPTSCQCYVFTLLNML